MCNYYTIMIYMSAHILISNQVNNFDILGGLLRLAQESLLSFLHKKRKDAARKDLAG